MERAHMKRISLVLAWVLVTVSLSATTIGEYRLNEKGIRYYDKNQPQNAVESFSKALEKGDAQGEILFNLGTVFLAEKDLDKAASNFQQAEPLLEGENKANAFYNLGNIYYTSGHFSDAIENFEKALEINPNDKDAKFNLELAKKASRELHLQSKQSPSKGNPGDKQNQQQNQQKNQQQDQNQKKKEEKKQNLEEKQEESEKEQKERAKQILNMMDQKEKEARREFLKPKKVDNNQVERDW